jgi:hypothetical protein
MNYTIGDLIRLYVTFQDTAGAFIDPTSLVLRIKLPDSTVTEWTYPGDITQTTTGKFQYDFLSTTAGTHKYRWEGTGTAQGAVEGSFKVAESAFV